MCAAAWTPAPSTANDCAPGLARCWAASALAAAVRAVVNGSPSINASGRPVTGSSTSTVALRLGRPARALPGFTLPNLHTGPVEGDSRAA
jgi:hypothetical protein